MSNALVSILSHESALHLQSSALILVSLAVLFMIWAKLRCMYYKRPDSFVEQYPLHATVELWRNKDALLEYSYKQSIGSGGPLTMSFAPLVNL